MKSYNKKCIGCGVILNDNPAKLGFVQNFDSEKTKYCKRCFNIIYYQKIDNSNLNYQEIENNFKSIKYEKNICIFHVIDVLNLDKSIMLNLIDFDNPLYFVVNKMDCLPKSYNAEITNEYIVKTIESYGFKNPKILYTSKSNNSSIKRLYKTINSITKKKYKPIFVGNTNVGKSSLLNSLKKINKQFEELTVSPFVNTTINFKKIKIDKNEIIDTPGLFQSTNITNYLDPENIKKISNFKNNKPINFFINPNQSLMIDALVIVSYLDGIKSNFTFYISNSLKIERMKLENVEKNFSNALNNSYKIKYVDNLPLIEHTFNLDENYKHNISIDGLGLISLNKGIKLIKIKVRPEVGVYLNKYAII